MGPVLYEQQQAMRINNSLIRAADSHRTVITGLQSIHREPSSLGYPVGEGSPVELAVGLRRVGIHVDKFYSPSSPANQEFSEANKQLANLD